MNLPTKSNEASPAEAVTPDLVAPSSPSYYERHIFFCLNERKGGEECCAHHRAQEGFDRCKSQVKAAGLSGPGQVRVNKAGCLDRCAGGPVAVVYPEAVWYSYVDGSDIDEIVESHLKNGQVVQRLLMPANVGR
jgi:(2Fe-2S) ferredoxin